MSSIIIIIIERENKERVLKEKFFRCNTTKNLREQEKINVLSYLIN